jgi:hypothetical protein
MTWSVIHDDSETGLHELRAEYEPTRRRALPAVGEYRHRPLLAEYPSTKLISISARNDKGLTSLKEVELMGLTLVYKGSTKEPPMKGIPQRWGKTVAKAKQAQDQIFWVKNFTRHNLCS